MPTAWQNLDAHRRDVLPERDVILEERRQRIDNDPGAQLGEMMNAALFLNHPYRMPTIGWENEMEALTTADARAFYDRWYAPNNAIVVIAGDVTLDEVRPLAEKYYGAIPARAVPARERGSPSRAVRAAPGDAGERARCSRPPGSRLSGAELSHRGAEQQPMRWRCWREILGGDTTSRLYRRLVVEQKLAVGAGADYGANHLDLAPSASTRRRPPGGELDQRRDGDGRGDRPSCSPTASPRTRWRAPIASLQAEAIKARDSLAGPARIVGGALASGSTIEDIEAWPDRIGAVTVAQVNAAAKAVFDINRSVTGLLLPKETS